MRVTVRRMMFLIAILGAGLASVVWWIRSAEEQGLAVNLLQEAGATVLYDFQLSSGSLKANGAPSGPAWLINRVGVDFLQQVVYVNVIKSRSWPESRFRL